MLRNAQGTIPPVCDIATGIVAKAGGTKAAATPLTAAINIIATCATGADSVLLPPAKAGLCLFISNRGAASAQVFGQGTDTVNDVATATGVAQANGVSAFYVCPEDGKWYRCLSA